MFPCKESRFGGRRREIEARGDDGAGARAPLGSGRKKEEERIDEWVPRHPDKYLGDASRTVRRHLADCPRGGCYNPTPKRNLAPRFNESLKGEL